MEAMEIVEFAKNYWVFAAILTVVYFVGKTHGRQDAINELHYAQEAQAQQNAFNTYVQGLQDAGGDDE